MATLSLTTIMSGFSVPATDTTQRDEFETLAAQTSSDEPSTISIFPSDVLSLIFRYTYDPIPPFDGRYRCPDSTTSLLVQALSLVSKHWYRTLMETSEFWTSINMSMEGTDISKYATGLVSFFEKTCYRSLSLSLDFSGLVDVEDDDDILLHPSADAVISKNLERIENLQLVKPPLAWFSHFHHLSRMDHLSLYQVQEDPIHLYLDRIPSLSKFTLVNGNIRLTNSCLGVTSLTLIGVPLDTCFNLFAHCPKLTKLHLEDYITSGQHMLDDNVPVPEAFLGPHQHLEVLIWKIFSTPNFVAPWQTALLKHINGNSLETLTWHQPPNWTLQESPSGQRLRIAIHNFFERLSQRLTCIEFIENYDSTWRTEARFIEHLRNDQGIHSLKFSECNTGFIMSIFEKLTDSPTRFPQLNTITIGKIVWSNPRNVKLDKGFEKMISERFLEMVKSRLKPMEGRLVVYFEDDSSYREVDGSNCAWLDHIKQEVVELTSCGYQIEFFIASKPE